MGRLSATFKDITYHESGVSGIARALEHRFRCFPNAPGRLQNSVLKAKARNHVAPFQRKYRCSTATTPNRYLFPQRVQAEETKVAVAGIGMDPNAEQPPPKAEVEAVEAEIDFGLRVSKRSMV